MWVMSKARLVITAAVVEGRTHADAAREYGVSRSWVTRLVGRWRVEGDAAYQPRSRRPRTSPSKVSDAVVELILRLRRELTAAGLDAGPDTICWHLKERHGVEVSASTVRRRLVAAGLVVPEPRKRPKSSHVRFAADLPNEMWQADMCWWSLPGGDRSEILSFIDDCSRYALSVSAHRRVSTPSVVGAFNETAAQHGCPASVLTDNAMYFTTRYAGGKGGPNAFETLLGDLNVVHKHSRPGHPQTCGKVERFQQTLKRWLAAQRPAATIAELQAQLDEFTDAYNNHRPHRSLGRNVPAAIYMRLPKAQPATDGHPSPWRIRHDHIDAGGTVTLRHKGRLHHIGIGRRHAHTPITMIVQDLNIRIINPTTGELLRQLTLDPTRDYQPQTRT